MNNHYNCIYMYINKLNGKKYVGQAKDFRRREVNHLSESKNKKSNKYNAPFHRAIRKYGIESFEMIILKENLKTQCLMNVYECYYIEKYNTLITNKYGYNVASGGSNGFTLAGKSEEEINEWKRKQSESHKGKHSPMCGKHHTEKSKKKISESKKGENNPNYGKHFSEEHRRKICESNKGREGLKGERNPTARKIAQYDKEGNLIKIWNCIDYACKELRICKPNICKCCRGERKSAGGFVWKYCDNMKGDE